jgi:Glycosyltransferase family 87
VELRHRGSPRLTVRRSVLLLALLLLAFPAAAHAVNPTLPPSQTEPPKYFKRSGVEVARIAERASKVRAAERAGPLEPTSYTRGYGRWQVSFFRDRKEVVQVSVDDASGAILEQWSGYQVAWRMARGYPGAFGRKLNAPYVWLPLCALFLLPFIDFRRPLRLLHLDLLVLLGFGVSHVFFNRGDIGVSVPLVYPVLLYLLVRTLLAGFRPRPRPGKLVPHLPLPALTVALVLLALFRIGLNVVDSNVIDVGYAGVIGADRIMDGDGIYGEGFSQDVGKGDTYGPLNYLLYVPFEQALPWSGRWDDLPAAHGAAIAFDLATIGLLLLLGRSLRPGREGTVLGVALAYAWTAYPYSSFVLETNANDTLVALACAGALLAYARRSALAAGAAVGLGAAAKFAPLILAPLFARRRPLVFALALAVVLAVTIVPFIPDGGVRELYDRTIGYQAGRGSPFSIWGQADLGWLHRAVKVGAVGLALLVAFVPRRPSVRQVAALGAAVLIALQLPVDHWFYLYVVWFVPFVLVTSFGAIAPPAPAAAESTVRAHPSLLPPAPRSTTGHPATSRSAPA